MANRPIDPASVALAALGGMKPQLVPVGGDLIAARPPNDRARIIDITAPTPGDPNPLREWGDVVRMPQGSQQDIDDTDRADVDSGWGRRQIVKFTDGPQQLARIFNATGEKMYTLSVDVLMPPLLGELLGMFSVPLTVWANIDFGGGSASANRKIRCDDHQDITVTACFLSISVFIGDLNGNPVTAQPFTNAPSAQVAVQVSRGTRGLPYVSSQFVTADGVLGVIFAAPVRVLSVSANLSIVAGGQRFLVLVDSGSGVVGVAPSQIVASYPLGTTPSPGVFLRYLNPRGFSQGLSFVVSTTSGAVIPAPESAHVEVEQYLL